MSSKHTPEPWPEPDVNHCGTRLIPLADYQRARICVNACAGIEDPAEAIREARGALFALLAVRENGDVPSWTAQWDDAEAALAKLQPKEAE